ncbi:MAG: ribonuclease III [Firmicutes bacterium]|nr:ribonuclease III [Bacillota bacterium]
MTGEAPVAEPLPGPSDKQGRPHKKGSGSNHRNRKGIKAAHASPAEKVSKKERGPKKEKALKKSVKTAAAKARKTVTAPATESNDRQTKRAKKAKDHVSRLTALLGEARPEQALLEQALTHSSFANEHPGAGLKSNERLEFLGDAVLGLAVADYLVRNYHESPEGEMTKARAAVVCEATLAQVAAKLNLGACLTLGRGEELTGGGKRPSILADALEALVGAIYLSHGYEITSRFVIKALSAGLRRVLGKAANDFKSRLQEIAQREQVGEITYRVVSEQGPDHSKTFTVEVRVGGAVSGAGRGRSKKEAEQSAARAALNRRGFLEGVRDAASPSD